MQGTSLMHCAARCDAGIAHELVCMRTQVFLRGGQMAALDKLRTDTLNTAATAIQRRVRGFLAQKHWNKLRESVLRLQVGGEWHGSEGWA